MKKSLKIIGTIVALISAAAAGAYLYKNAKEKDVVILEDDYEEEEYIDFDDVFESEAEVPVKETKEAPIEETPEETKTESEA